MRCRLKGYSLASSDESGKKIWRARIAIAGREVSLGQWDTPEEAARAYDTVAITLKVSIYPCLCEVVE